MKLRLPHKLQTALLTAFASVTFTTIGTATLAAAQGDASTAESVTSTGFVVSEEELEVDLGEEDDEESTEPDSAPINEAGFNGVPGSSDAADRNLSVSFSVSEGGTDTTPAAGTVSGQETSVSEVPVSDDLGFTTQVTDGTAPAASAPVFQMSAAPAAQQVQAVETATQENSTTNTTSSDSSDSSTSPLNIDTTGGGTYAPYYGYLAAPARAAAPTVGAVGDTTKYATWNFEGNMNASSTTGSALNPTWKGGGSASYVDTGMYIGWECGNGTSVVTTNLGQAIDISSSQWIQVASGNTFINGGEIPLDLNHSFTVSAWVKLDAVTSERFIMGTGAYGGKGFSMALNSGKLDFLDKDVAHHNFNNTPSLLPEEWYNFTITYDQASNKTYGYVNGLQIGELSTSGWKVVSSSTDLAIGSGSTNQKQAAFDGQIAYMDIVGDYLSQADIRGRYAATPLSEIGTYTWNGGEGETWEDAAWLLNETDDQTFVAGSDAVFGNGGTHSIGVSATTGVHHAEVADNYTFQLADGIMFSAYELDVAQGAGATFQGGSGTEIVVNTLTGAGNVNLNGGTMNIIGGAAMAGTIGVQSGAINVLGQSTFGTVEMTGAAGTMNIIGGTAVTGTVNATAGTINVLGEATFASLDMNRGGTSTAAVVVKEGGVLTLGALQKSESATLTLEEGGAADMLGKVYAVGLEGNGSVLGSGACSFESSNYTLQNVAVSARDVVTIGNKLENSTITVDNYVTLTNGENTLTSTTVNSTRLIVADTMNLGAVEVNGGELSLTSTSPVTMASGTIGSAGTLKLSQGEQFTVDGGVFGFASGATLDLSTLSIAPGTESITLGTASNGGSFSTHNLGNVILDFGAGTTYDNASLTVDAENRLLLTFELPKEVLYWKGGPGTWDKTSPNWYPSNDTSRPRAFADNDNIVFSAQGDSMVTITRTEQLPEIIAGDIVIEQGVNLNLSSDGISLQADKVDVKGNLTVSNVAVTANSLNIERGSHVTADVQEAGRTGALATNVSGAGDITKDGAGALILTGDNSEFSGKVTIEQGALIARGDAGTALGDSPNVVLNGGELQGAITPGGDINITAAKDGAAVSADIRVAENKALTFNAGAGITLTSSGNISGAGDIYKEGTGTLVLDTANSFTGNLDINAGTVLVSNVGAVSHSSNVTVGTGTNLVFEEGSDVYRAASLTLDRGSRLTFSGAVTEQENPLLQIGTLNLTSNSSVDFSKFEINRYGTYVLASVEDMRVAEPGIWKPGQEDNLVQFITMAGMNTAEGFNLSPEDLVSLHYNQTTKLLTLEVTQANRGYYWIPDRGEDSVWDTETANWLLNNQGNPTTFENKTPSLTESANSAYFLNAGDDKVEDVTLNLADIKIRDLIVDGGEYTFTFAYTQGYLTQDTNRLSNFVVRSGSKAHFKNTTVYGGNLSVVHICQDAEATIEGVYDWQAFSVNNEGTYTVEFDQETAVAMGLLGHVDNTGDMSVSIKASEAGGFFMVGEVMNREGASMVIAIPVLFPDISYGDGIVHNMGDLAYGLPDEGVEGTMTTPLPIDGTGSFKTQGAGLTIQQNATVTQALMELGAGQTEISGVVTISDSTTVKSGATGVLSASGTLGEVTLEEAATLRLVGDGATPESYHAGNMVAGAGSLLDVEKDASLDLASYNAGREATGSIVVGNLVEGDTGLTPAVLRVEGETNVASLTVKDGTAHLHGGGTVTSLSQTDGTLRFCSDAYLGGGTVSGGTLRIENDRELTLGRAITVDGGNYTVAATTGSINASALELVENMENAGYVEVGATVEEKTPDKSGFLNGGQQYVQVFNLAVEATLTSNSVTVTHKNAAGPMTLDNTGRGYLDTNETVYASYYVRDNYVSGQHGTRTGSDRNPDYVKLSNVMTTSHGQLQTVVFDTTDYNKNETAVTGSLTVDVQDQHADLFDVKKGATGVVSIGNDADGARVMLCCCEEFGSVEGTMLIAGTGIYQLENRGTLGGGVSLLDETKEGIGPWTGTVRITGSGEDLVMAPLAVGSGENASEIEFSHWSGSFEYKEEEPVVSNAKILLTGTGLDAPAAITLTPGNADMVWTNTVQGDNGRINHGQEGGFTLLMTGDTSEWNGVFSQSAANTTVTLGFMDNVSASGTQSAEMQASNGTMDVTYGGNVKTVNGKATVFGQGDMKLTYTGTDMTVNGTIQQFQQQGKLTLTVGDGTDAASATFSGVFDSTDNATMTVEKGSTATINTDAALLRVVGEEGSSVNVTSGSTLSLASTDPEESYSQFYNVDNRGTIEMQASGGDIKLVDTTGKTYDLGDLALVGTPGTAAIETSGVSGATTNVNITALRGTTDVLELTNDNAAGTVNYNLGGGTAFSGTIEFGSDGAAGDANVVLDSNGVAANAVLKSTGDSSGTADVVVNTANAQVLGIDSTGSVDGKLYGVDSQRVVTVTGDGTYSYNGALGQNLDVAYTGSGKQTFEGGATDFSGKVTVNDGDTATQGILEILNASSVSITDLTIGANDTLNLNDGSNVGTAEVSGTMKAGGTSNAPSKLDGNLTMGSSSTYDVSASAGTGGLQLTGALTIAQGAQLSANDLAGVLDLGWFGMYDLAFDVTDMAGFGADVDWSQGVDASTVFGNEALGGRKEEFYIRYSQSEMGGNGNNVGAVYIYRIPEPATSTLSLLALCALAARRRRK